MCLLAKMRKKLLTKVCYDVIDVTRQKVRYGKTADYELLGYKPNLQLTVATKYLTYKHIRRGKVR